MRMANTAEALGFTKADDLPVPYMQRLRDYYLALGYGNPYRWAQYADVPFTPLEKPLAASRVGLVTTAGPYREGAGDQGPGAAYNAAAKFYQAYAESSDEDRFLGISHLGYDRHYSTAEDMNSFFPLKALRKAAEKGRIGEVSPRFYGAPTNRSQVATIEQDSEDLIHMMREDRVDAAVIVGN
jgi:Glycine/sarcosine/betaine reductase selenoprotein B (GRDB)